MLAWIQDLYRIDARSNDMTERGRLRDTESRAVTATMHAWLTATHSLKSTSLGGAIRYTLGIWTHGLVGQQSH